MQPANHTSEQKPAEEQNGRDDKGRFTRGNTGGPGNPFARQTARLRQAVLDAVTEDDVRDIVKAMKEKAKQGDVAAAKLLLSYSAGKPAAAPDPDTLDRAELDTMARNHIQSMESAMQVVEGLPLSVLMILLRHALPFLNDNKGQFIKDFFKMPAAEGKDQTPASSQEQPTPPASGRSMPPARGAKRNGKRTAAVPVDRPMPPNAPEAGEIPSVDDDLLRMFLRGNGQPAPSANGNNGQPAPTANGNNRQPAPTANGSNGKMPRREEP